ncbi:cobalamin-binding protein [Lignipirellula cremea]|uniref:Corrinoid ABC transporter substrate-binding protein n=1 Tax=Lignipirellula cremea TaxID=2528010 RepID=A0A518DQ53_9BACT|nr:cobalamin-binding protein [Lignipirellula cremea]QDU93934.1 corrinoid ABC transporter substrate-binding protein [Lignipirellula cremea]
MRIVSLLPSATEIVCLLGLQEQLVGVTHECDYPPGVLDLPKVTQTLIPKDASSAQIDGLVRERLETQAALYTLNMPVLEELRPDLIVTQALCDVCAVSDAEVQAAACSLPGRPAVVNLEPARLGEVFDCIRLVGDAANCSARAEQEIADLQRRVQAVAVRSESVTERPRVLLLEWIDPPFCCGHWSPELVRLAGGQEMIGVEGDASQTTDWAEIVAADPEFLMIACCGFSVLRTQDDLPLLRAFPGWNDLSCVRNDRVWLVDGSAYFSRSGPRLVDSLEILAHTLHPQLHPLPSFLPPAIRVPVQGD